MLVSRCQKTCVRESCICKNYGLFLVGFVNNSAQKWNFKQCAGMFRRCFFLFVFLDGWCSGEGNAIKKANLTDNLSVVHQIVGPSSHRALVEQQLDSALSQHFLMHSRGVWVYVRVDAPLPRFLLFVCNYKQLRPRCSGPSPVALRASERGDCCQLLSTLFLRPKVQRFKSHLSRTIDVCHLSWPVAGPNKDALIGKGWHVGSLIWGCWRGSLKLTEKLAVL